MTKRISVVLKESEVEKASLILAARSITSDLQSIAEKLSKMEAEKLMPISDGLRFEFGRDMADRFTYGTTDAIRELIDSIRTARDNINGSIVEMERYLAGDDTADIDDDLGVEDEMVVSQEGDTTVIEPDTEEGFEPVADTTLDDETEELDYDDALGGTNESVSNSMNIIESILAGMGQDAQPKDVIKTLMVNHNMSFGEITEAMLKYKNDAKK